MELGYFIAKLGRPHVCPLYTGSLDLPSDYLGVGYIPMDSHEAWKYKLGKELQAAGFLVDLNRIYLRNSLSRGRDVLGPLMALAVTSLK
jgi:predicted nucleotide-binding protein